MERILRGRRTRRRFNVLHKFRGDTHRGVCTSRERERERERWGCFSNFLAVNVKPIRIGWVRRARRVKSSCSSTNVRSILLYSSLPRSRLVKHLIYSLYFLFRLARDKEDDARGERAGTTRERERDEENIERDETGEWKKKKMSNEYEVPGCERKRREKKFSKKRFPRGFRNAYYIHI